LTNLNCEITKLKYNLEEEQKNKLKEVADLNQKIIYADKNIKVKDDMINSLQVQN